MAKATTTPAESEVSDKIELLKRLMLCKADIQFSLSAITFLSEAVDPDEAYSTIEIRRIKCFETAFIVSYGRAFTNSRGGRYKSLSLKKIGLSLTTDEEGLHRKILDARHRKIAHSDLDAAHSRIDLHSIDLEGKEVSYHHLQWDEGLDFWEFDELQRIMDLQHKLLLHLFNYTRPLAIELKGQLPVYLRPTDNG